MTQKVINGENCGKEGASNRIKSKPKNKPIFMFIYDFYRTNDYCPKLGMEESPSFSISTAKIITINIKTNHPLKIAALAFKPVTKSKKIYINNCYVYL